MPKIDILKRKEVILNMESGLSQREVARKLKISRGAVEGLWKKYVTHGNVKNRKKCGRPRKTTDREERLLVKMSKQEPKSTAPRLMAQWSSEKTVSVSTVKRILCKYGLFGRQACRKPVLNNNQIKRRLEWCKAYSKLDDKFWDSVIYTDECRIEMYSNKKQIVRRPVNSRYLTKYTTKTWKHGYKSLMIWGAIKSDGSRMLIKCPNILNSMEYQSVLERGLLPVYESGNVFQQDGAPCHTSKSTIDFIEKSQICLLSDWPSQSPDLNIIEPLWAILKRNVAQHHCNTVDELWSTCYHEWSSISDETIKRLYKSIHNRLNEVMRNKGHNTRY